MGAFVPQNCTSVRGAKSALLWVVGRWVKRKGKFAISILHLPTSYSSTAYSGNNTSDSQRWQGTGGGRTIREMRRNAYRFRDHCLARSCRIRSRSYGVIHSRYSLLYREKNDFPSKTSRNKNTYTLIDAYRCRLYQLFHAYGLNSELLRSAFLVLSMHMHTTSTTKVRTLSNLHHQFQHGGLYIISGVFRQGVFFYLTTIIYRVCPINRGRMEWIESTRPPERRKWGAQQLWKAERHGGRRWRLVAPWLSTDLCLWTKLFSTTKFARINIKKQTRGRNQDIENS